MYVMNLSYQKPITEVEKYLEAHNEYLKKFYSAGNFICSGRKNPRTGGMIIGTFKSIEEANKAIEEDPFYQNKIAKYDITEFIPTKMNTNYLTLKNCQKR
ncbi:GTP cyclohydrolase [Enterococcus sp. DIV0242_7C1]|nr:MULTISPECIES: YciI family protein [unclassified Enterococcus]MBO0470819.1 GTP cyclohydrolase [Enterococcus sp. DIV0242_7C1]